MRCFTGAELIKFHFHTLVGFFLSAYLELSARLSPHRMQMLPTRVSNFCLQVYKIHFRLIGVSACVELAARIKP
jgi:hypothetical protein